MPLDTSKQDAREIRALTVDDVPWLMSLAYKRYGPYEPGKILVYLLETLRNRDALCLRTGRAFMIAGLIMPIWRTENPECNIIALCAEEGAHWEAVKLLRRSVDWARERQCRKWWFGSETKHDISALAKRVGGTECRPRYEIEF
jgi:hypothetical protein